MRSVGTIVMLGLGLGGCLDSVDPTDFSNFSSRVELAAEVGSVLAADGWVLVRPEQKRFFLIRADGGGTAAYELPSPLELGALLGGGSLEGLSSGGSLVEVGDYAAIGFWLCCSESSPQTVAGAVMSVGPTRTGETVAHLVLPEARMTRGKVIGTSERIGLVLENPPALAIFDASGLPETPTYLAEAPCDECAEAIGGSLYERGSATFGLLVGVDRMTPFALRADNSLSFGERVHLRPDDESYERVSLRISADVFPLDNNLVLVSDGGEQVFVVDLNDPFAPEVIASVDGFGEAQKIASAGDGLVAVANGFNGVGLVDVAEPTRPVLLNLSRGGNSVFLSSDPPYIYSAGEFPLKIYMVVSPTEL